MKIRNIQVFNNPSLSDNNLYVRAEIKSEQIPWEDSKPKWVIWQKSINELVESYWNENSIELEPDLRECES